MTVNRRAAGRLRLLLSLLLIATLLPACSLRKGEPAPKQETAPSSVEGWLSYLTLEEKVGQLFWVGLPGTHLSQESQQLLAEGRVGGFILFGRQGSDPATLQGLTVQLQEGAAARERFTPGLIISVDHEGGLVQRFGPPFTQWPGNMALGATGSEAYAEQAARAMAQELKAVGVTMNLAPDADVNSNPANPVIGIRSFGEDPALVSRLVTAQIRGFQAGGVSAVAKHFPGHGDTAVDSHKALPLVSHPLERLERVEFPPFRAAMVAGVDAIMSAHIIFPAVAEGGLPATLSPQVLTGLLKEKMGYQGLVVTDAMDAMKAITDQWGGEKGLIMAIQAGADAVLVTESFGTQQALQALVVKAVQDGQIPESRLNDAVRRVLTLKAKRGLLPTTKGGTTKDSVTNEGTAATVGSAKADLSTIGAAAHQELSRRIGADALTLVRNGHLPLQLTKEDRLLVIGAAYGPRLSRSDGIVTALGAGIKAEHDETWEVTLDRKPSAASLQNARQMAAQAAAVVYGVYNGQDYPEHLALIRELIATGKPVVVVGMGMPYELTKVPAIGTYIAAYGYQDANLFGVGPLLFGKAEAKGHLPVTIPNLYPAGHGLAR